MKQWILDRKLSTRVETLQPGKWFHEMNTKSQKAIQQWHKAQTDYRTLVSRKASEKAAKAAKKAREAAAAAAAKAKANKAADGEKKDEEAKPVEVEEEEAEEDEIDASKLDVFDVADVNDVGGGLPLFQNFDSDDWALLTLRFELYLLGHAFRKDVDDPERVGIQLDHFPFYYNKYFKKAITPNAFGMQDFKEVCALVDDTVFITEKNVLEPNLGDDMETFQVFIQITEETRRQRQLRIDAGEEGAKLKIKKDAAWSDNRGSKRDYQGSQPQWQQGNAASKWTSAQKNFGSSGGNWKQGAATWAK